MSVVMRKAAGGLSYRCLIASLLCCSASSVATAAVYRVGPGQEYSKVSQVADRLEAGDVVEITGDIVDAMKLTKSGLREKPIIVRGVTTIEGGEIVRPKVVGSGVEVGGCVIACRGDWNVIEGLDIRVDPGELIEKGACIRVWGDNDVVRNCRMSRSWFGVNVDGVSAGDILIEFCDLDSIYRPLTFSHYAIAGRRLPVATLQHCYVHDCTGGYTMVRSEYPRVVVRYNWFENASNKAMSIVGPAWPAGRKDPQAAHCWPAHADIVGNVFFHGVSPDGTHAILTLGGESDENPGPEGDINISHNLFVRTENGWDEELSSHILMLSNVDNVRLFNNVFVDYVNVSSSIYNTVWYEGISGYQATAEFAAGRGGNAIPPAHGSNNWVSQDAGGVPVQLEGTIKGLNPGMVNFLERDYRPRPDSPLVGSGQTALPKGSIAELVPEYEPQRGVPANLEPIKRRQTNPPSIGPFEAADKSAYVEGADRALEAVLRVKKSGARFPWELEFGQALQKALMFVHQGDKEKALQAARMHFILSVDSQNSIERVGKLLEELDGNDARAKAFSLYATCGPDGPDGEAGTADDLTDPLADVPLTLFLNDDAWYRDCDAAIDGRIAFCSEREAKESFYMTEKAFARINGATFDEAAAILLESLERLVTLDAKGREGYDGHAAFKRTQHQIDGIRLGLGAYYRATAGTTKGTDEFVTACINFCAYGPMGPDKKLGSEDDLKPPR